MKLVFFIFFKTNALKNIDYNFEYAFPENSCNFRIDF